MLGLTKPRTPVHTVCGIKLGTLESVRSVGNWELGVIVSPDQRQATVQFDLPGVARLDEASWSQWEQAIAQIPQIVATFTIDTIGDNAPGVRAGAVFRAVGAAETKDHDTFLADVAIGVAPLFDAADAIFPVESRPLTPAEVCTHLSAGLGIEQATTWDELTGIDTEETDSSVTIAGVEWEVFQTPPDADGLFGEIDDLTNDWEGVDWLRRTRIFRPLIIADGVDDTMLAGSGRRHQLITIVGGPDATGAALSYFNSAAAISLRRSWQRQKRLAVEGLGTGLLGFQNPMTHLRRPTPLPSARY